MKARLTRSRTDTVLGGVAAGVADWIDADPALVRIAWALLVPLTGGIALVAYIVGWIVIPEAPAKAADSAEDAVVVATEEPPDAKPRDDGRTGIAVGIGLVLVGLWFLAREYLPDIDWNVVWPLLIVGVGMAVLVSAIRRRD